MMTSQWARKRRNPVGLAILLTLAAIPLFAGTLSAASGHDSASMENHGDMAVESQAAGAFQHTMTAEGIEAEFQIMSLESMNMQDPGGATHHVMVKFMDAASGRQIQDAVGRIKVIAPSEEETVVDLKDYSGIYAANVSFDEAGKYGIICLAKVGGEKPLYKFWYPHRE